MMIWGLKIKIALYMVHILFMGWSSAKAAELTAKMSAIGAAAYTMGQTPAEEPIDPSEPLEGKATEI